VCQISNPDLFPFPAENSSGLVTVITEQELESINDDLDETSSSNTTNTTTTTTTATTEKTCVELQK